MGKGPINLRMDLGFYQFRKTVGTEKPSKRYRIIKKPSQMNKLGEFRFKGIADLAKQRSPDLAQNPSKLALIGNIRKLDEIIILRIWLAADECRSRQIGVYPFDQGIFGFREVLPPKPQEIGIGINQICFYIQRVVCYFGQDIIDVNV